MAPRLADLHILAQERLRAALEKSVAVAWQVLPSYDEVDVAPWLDLVVPMVLGAQRRSVALTNGYVALALDRPTFKIEPDDVIASVRGDVTPEQVYRRPFVTVWTGLKDGVAWADAVNAGEARAVAAAVTDVQLAMRATLLAVAKA